MSNGKKLVEKADAIKRQQDALKDQIKTFVQTKTIPLEERWSVFSSSRMGDHDDYYIHWEHLPQTLITNTYSRYSKIDVCDLLDLWNEDDGVDHDLFKEEIMSKFIASYILDW